MIVKDVTARRLENRQLWRRAATRWLVLMSDERYTSEERDWMRLRRNYCVSMTCALAPESPVDIAEVRQAATRTLRRMKMDWPGGQAFRRYPRAPEP